VFLGLCIITDWICVCVELNLESGKNQLQADVSSSKGKRTEKFSEKSTRYRDCFKSEVRCPLDKRNEVQGCRTSKNNVRHMPLAIRAFALVYNPRSHYFLTFISLDNQETGWGLIMSAQNPRCPRRCDPWSKLVVRI
jgi:hypothetical protein